MEEQVVVIYAGTRGYLDKVAERCGRASRPNCCGHPRRPSKALLETSATRRTLQEQRTAQDEDAIKAALNTLLKPSLNPQSQDELAHAQLEGTPPRIASVKSTQKITKALQIVATAKLKRAQEAAQASRP